jgi:hypothetical protein
MSQNAQGDHPGYQQEHHTVLPAHAAATATEKLKLYVAERACRVKKVAIHPSAAVTGDNTNRTNLNVDKNTTEVANLDLDTGTDLVAQAETVLYEPATPLPMAAGDYIGLEWEKVASGVLVPALAAVVVVDFEP